MPARRRTRSVAGPGRPEPAEEPTSIGSGQVHPGAAYTRDETEFLKAVERYQKRAGKKFLSHVDYLRVLVGLGYRLTEPTERPK